MIHRIDRVNPDVDDRVIKPNEARMATNLRFGASTEDTNLSGGTLILGNTELPFTPPAGTNKVVGVYADLELRNVYFALYNSLGNHGLYQIEAENNNQVKKIIENSNLNFKPDDDYNVSITVIAGNLYWTDNVNEPRVININKGIRTAAGFTTDVYPPVWVDWYYSQIKRPPLEPLTVNQLDLNEVSKTYLNKTQVEIGLQYSYYFIYDGGAESRLGPVSEITYANFNIQISVGADYILAEPIAESIVIVVRSGNDGVWRELTTHKFSQGIKTVFNFSNVLTSIKGPVSSDITDARFDSVPLLSKTNEVAQNRINHGNYILDNDSGEPLQINAKILWAKEFIANFRPDYDPQFLSLLPDYDKYSFMPWGRYTIGVEYVDKYGRTVPVSNAVEVDAPYVLQSYKNLSNNSYSPGTSIQLGSSNLLNDITLKDFSQNTGYSLVGKVEISGTIPAWVDKVNIVRSKAKNIVKMIQSVGNMFLWYKRDDGTDISISYVQQQLFYLDIYTEENNVIYQNGVNVGYTFNGYILKFNDTEAPIVYEDGMYITIYQSYKFTNNNNIPLDNSFGYWTQYNWSGNDVGRFAPVVKFKVNKIVGNLIFISKTDTVLINPYFQSTGQILGDPTKPIVMTPFSFPNMVNKNPVNNINDANNPDNNFLLYYNFTITVEKNIEDQIVYSTPKVLSAQVLKTQISTFGKVNIYLNGDASICSTKHTVPQTRSVTNIYVAKLFNNTGPFITKNVELLTPSFTINGSFISMSPRDIYDENWNQSIGHPNTTNYYPSTPQRFENGICFSAPFIPGTQVNGLNKFNSLDYRLAPAENGPITSLVVTNATQREPGVMLAIGSFGISSFYYDAIQLNNVDGSANVTTTNTYLASQRPLLGQYGTTRPMSITKTPLGTVYWWSDVVNDLIRYTNAGLERLGMTFSFANYLRKKYNNNPLIITWYDQVTDEINLLGNRELASVFSERYKTFQGERSYYNDLGQQFTYPERGIGIATKQFLFIEGKIWVTDVEFQGSNAPDDNFIFGSYKDPEINIVTNENPAVVKRWNQIKLFGSRPNTVFLEAPDETEGPGGILTSFIDTGYWIKRKGDWEAAIRRADNTNGGLMAGKLMESRIIYSKFAWSAQGFQKLNFIEVKSNVSLVQ